MSYMEQVAQMLGVELEEEFKIEGYDDSLKFKFSENFFLQSCGYGWVSSCSLINVLEGTRKIIKLPKPVLDKVEKKYLKKIIRPWKDRVIYVTKVKAGCRSEREYIIIATEDNGLKHYTELPFFEANSMYKGMELNKEYSLEDLELWV